jgi:hypothetical protein
MKRILLFFALAADIYAAVEEALAR